MLPALALLMRYGEGWYSPNHFIPVLSLTGNVVSRCRAVSFPSPYHLKPPSAEKPHLVKVISQVPVAYDDLYQQPGFPPVAAVDELCPVLVSPST